MTQEEGNKLIAHFDGMSRCETEHDIFYKRGTACSPENWEYHQLQLKYHTSWDWLMPVVEKIAKMGYRVKTNFNSVDNSVIIQHMTNSEQTLSMMYYSKPLEVVWLAVIQFIEWYNQNPQ